MNQPLTMDKIQKVSLEILKHITKICDENGFKYCLMYGTLIGAIRHKGYIPWDDDVDIMMPRPDYEALLLYLKNHPQRLGRYQIFNRTTHKDYRYTITRIADSDYVIDTGDKYSCGMGIFIDVYPYDGLGNNPGEALAILKDARRLCDCLYQTVWQSVLPPANISLHSKIFYFINHLKNKLLGGKRILNKIENLRRYEYDESEYVGPLWYFTKPERVLFKRNIFENMIKVSFEDSEFNVPRDYHEVLTQEYGNYMELPPIDQRIYHHHYKAYKKLK